MEGSCAKEEGFGGDSKLAYKTTQDSPSPQPRDLIHCHQTVLISSEGQASTTKFPCKRPHSLNIPALQHGHTGDQASSTCVFGNKLYPNHSTCYIPPHPICLAFTLPSFFPVSNIIYSSSKVSLTPLSSSSSSLLTSRNHPTQYFFTSQKFSLASLPPHQHLSAQVQDFICHFLPHATTSYLFFLLLLLTPQSILQHLHMAQSET